MWLMRAAKPHPSSSACLQLEYRVSLFYAPRNVVASLLDLKSAALTFSFYLPLQTCISLSFWERSCCCDDRVCLCVTMYDKRRSVFKVTVRAKETCDPGALVLVDVWSNLVMSRIPPHYFCALCLHSSGGVLFEEQRKKYVRTCEAWTVISFCCLSARKCLFYCTSLTTSVFGSCPDYATCLIPAMPWSGNSRGKGSFAHSHRM